MSQTATPSTENPLTKYEGLLVCKQAPLLRPMTEEESSIYIHMHFAQDQPMPEPLKAKLERTMAYNILTNRFAAQGGDPTGVNWTLFVFISALIDRPGTAVLWAYTLFLMQQRIGKGQMLDLGNFSTNFFPMGVPTEEGYETCWEAQKGGSHPGGNLLDYCPWPKP